MSNHIRPDVHPEIDFDADPATLPIAPDHYRPGNGREDYGLAADYDEFLRRVAYKPGDVVWLDANPKPIKARILGISPDRDADGFRRPRFRVQLQNADGTRFCRSYQRAYPGQIQRGYIKMGWGK